MTDNVERHLEEHNAKKHFYTKRHTPWRLLHTEEFANRIDARKRENILSQHLVDGTLKNIYSNIVFAGSSNGRTIASGAIYLGSSPSPAARLD